MSRNAWFNNLQTAGKTQQSSESALEQGLNLKPKATQSVREEYATDAIRDRIEPDTNRIHASLGSYRHKTDVYYQIGAYLYTEKANMKPTTSENYRWTRKRRQE
jgi:hypothetical protein